MRIIVNGIEIPNPRGGLNVLALLDGDEEMGAIIVRVEGGCLRVRGEHHAITATGDGREPWLELHGGGGRRRDVAAAAQADASTTMARWTKRGVDELVRGAGP